MTNPLLNKKQRWFLLEMFLIASGVVICWVGWNCWQVRERMTLVEWIEHRGGIVCPYGLQSIESLKGTEPEWYLKKRDRISRVRLWFGDKAIYYICLTHASVTWADRERIAQLFPEAFVVPEHPNGFHPNHSETGNITSKAPDKAGKE